jgi:hypothetical protein
MSHIIEKILTKVTTFLEISLQLEVWKKIINVQSGKSPDFGNFETFNLEVPRKMIIGCNPYDQS